MYLIFVLGTAGSGKSELTGVFTRWLELQGENAMAVNLDPGAISTPYSANVDVRDYIRVESLMEEYGLGPNGGLMLASEMMLEIVEQLSSDLDDFGPDIAIIDTPGQMEMFAFRDVGARIAEEIMVRFSLEWPISGSEIRPLRKILKRISTKSLPLVPLRIRAVCQLLDMRL